EPTPTSEYVPSPAVFWRISRSTPMADERTSASPRRQRMSTSCTSHRYPILRGFTLRELVRNASGVLRADGLAQTPDDCVLAAAAFGLGFAEEGFWVMA